MPDAGIPLEIQALSFLLCVVMLGGGIMLSRGVGWLFSLGIPLPRKTERVEVVVPEGIEGDLTDSAERLHAFDLEDYRSAFWLSPTRIGLLYWAVSLGARNSLHIPILRGMGVLATGLVEIEREATHTTFHWRPVLRLGPLLFVGVLVLMSGITFGLGDDVLPLAGIWGLIYLGLAGWTLRQLPGMYESVSAQLVARAHDSR